MPAQEQASYSYPKIGKQTESGLNAKPSTAKTHLEISRPIKAKSSSSSLKWTVSEKILAGLAALIFVVCSVLTVYTSNRANSLNREIQDLHNQINETEIANENLKQNAQELAQYERIKDIAEKNGLEFNEQNVRNISQ